MYISFSMLDSVYMLGNIGPRQVSVTDQTLFSNLIEQPHLVKPDLT